MTHSRDVYHITSVCSLSIPIQIILLWPSIPIPLYNVCANWIFILHHFVMKYCYGILKKLVGFNKINCFYIGKWILKSGPILSPSVTFKVFCIQVNNQTSPYCYTRLRTSLTIGLFFFLMMKVGMEDGGFGLRNVCIKLKGQWGWERKRFIVDDTFSSADLRLCQLIHLLTFLELEICTLDSLYFPISFSMCTLCQFKFYIFTAFSKSLG